jgi:MFS family permease
MIRPRAPQEPAWAVSGADPHGLDRGPWLRSAAVTAGEASAGRRRTHPWWIPPFLGRVPHDLDDHHLTLLGAVALALLFEEYDQAMLTSALKFFAADLGMTERELPTYLGVIRLGALPAFAVIPLADRIGRRSVFLLSVAAMGVTTFLTAFSQSAIQFVVLQMITRTFFVTGSAVAFVFITEEFPAARRGWGVGMLGALSQMGHGLGAALFALIDRLPYGWRALYAVGIVPVLLLPFFWRRIPETARFARARAAAGVPDAVGVLGWTVPLRGLVRAHPGRAFGVALIGFLPAMGFVVAFQFTGYFTMTVHGWTPGEYALMIIVGGAVGIIGNVVAGRLSDRFGRRRVGFVLLSLFPVTVASFYLGPASWLPLSWAAFLFTAQGGRVILRALATELFATAHRGAASGLFAILEAAGNAAGLFVLGFGLQAPGDLARIIPVIALSALVGGGILWLFPETRQRELEAIA